jgi:hypothetical protein
MRFQWKPISETQVMSTRWGGEWPGRARASEWKQGAPKLDIWQAILAWAERKTEDAVEQECGRDQLKALRNILQDVENKATSAFKFAVSNTSITIEGSITNAIEEEYDRLCLHPEFHSDCDGGMLRCCTRKHLFNEMLEALPEFPPVRKGPQHRGYGN